MISTSTKLQIVFVSCKSITKSSFEEFNSKMKLEKIYFSQKGRCAFVSQNLLNIINYCFGKSDRFIVNRNKLLIRSYLLDIDKIYKSNLKTVDSMNLYCYVPILLCPDEFDLVI